MTSTENLDSGRGAGAAGVDAGLTDLALARVQI